MKSIKFITLTILILGIFLSACNSEGNLNTTSWRLISLGGKSALPDTTVTLNLNDGELGGSDGCNTYSGSYSSKGDGFTVGTDIVSTMMYCNDVINSQSSAYYLALGQSATYKLQNQLLTLLDANGIALMEFSRTDE